MSEIIQEDDIRFNQRAGTANDPYIPLTDTPVKIVNNFIQLQQVPSQQDGVTISGYYEVQKQNWQDNPTLASNQFYVNYTNGWVGFNPSENGKSVQPVYTGRGMVMYPASRIYVDSDNPWLVGVLQDIIDKILQLISNMNSETVEFQNIMKNFKYVGSYDSTKQYYQWNIVAENGSSFLCLADCINQDPTTSSGYWGMLAQKGDNGVNGQSIHWQGTYSPVTKYNYLDIVIYNTSLYLCTVTNSQNIVPTDIGNWALIFDGDRLNNMVYCYYANFKRNQVSINHNLNGYPKVRVLAMSSYGHGGFGMFNLYGSTYEEAVVVEYTDLNNVRLFLAEEYAGTATVTEVNANEYTVTFSNETYPLTIYLSLT